MEEHSEEDIVPLICLILFLNAYPDILSALISLSNKEAIFSTSFLPFEITQLIDQY